MTAVDTNVLVRLLTGDDPKQTEEARAILGSGPIWISKTVLLETAWVLRRLYALDDGSIRDAFVHFLGLDNVEVEDERAVAGALVLSAQGLDFADALHLSSRPAGVKFMSFDRQLVRRAIKAGVNLVSLPSQN